MCWNITTSASITLCFFGSCFHKIPEAVGLLSTSISEEIAKRNGGGSDDPSCSVVLMKNSTSPHIRTLLHPLSIQIAFCNRLSPLPVSGKRSTIWLFTDRLLAKVHRYENQFVTLHTFYELHPSIGGMLTTLLPLLEQYTFGNFSNVFDFTYSYAFKPRWPPAEKVSCLLNSALNSMIMYTLMSRYSKFLWKSSQ